MTSFDELVKAVQPPKNPVGVPQDYDWATLEEVQPISNSYKELMCTYGAGYFGYDFLRFYTPNFVTPFNNFSITERSRGIQLKNFRAGLRIPPKVRSDCFFPVNKLGIF